MLTYNMTILYPPTLTGAYCTHFIVHFHRGIGTFEIMFSDWTPSIEPSNTLTTGCPIYLLRAPTDQFGCAVNETEYGLPKNVSDIIGQRGYVDVDLEVKSPMVAMMVQEGYKRDIQLTVRSMSIMRRGQCTFVEKAKLAAMLGSDSGKHPYTYNNKFYLR